VRKGEELLAPDSKSPVKVAADLCLVKLLVGPGVTAETDSTTRSCSQGIGIEVWLPTQANWNERIRNCGGGGWVGGGHRFADKIGSKVPAIGKAARGFPSGHTSLVLCFSGGLSPPSTGRR
jgi:feruloyl esterase